MGAGAPFRVIVMEPQGAVGSEAARVSAALSGGDAVVLGAVDERSALGHARNRQGAEIVLIGALADVALAREIDARAMLTTPAAGLREILAATDNDAGGLVADRLRALYTLTALGSDPLAALEEVPRRIAEAFGVSACTMWWRDGDLVRRFASATPTSIAVSALRDERCQCALLAGCTLVCAPVEGAGTSYLSASLEPPGSIAVGALSLIEDGARLFHRDDRVALELVAERLALELAWAAAHRRLVAEHERLVASALMDPMLNVWSRSALEQVVATEIATARRRRESLAVGLLDVVQLRLINDRYGHLAGDAALSHVTRTLRGNLRAQDVVGRYGGDEIAILFCGTDAARAEAVMEKMIRLVRETPVQHEGSAITVEVCAGLTGIRREENTGSAAFARAEQAVRDARAAGVSHRVIEEVVVEPHPVDAAELAGAVAEMPTLGGMYRLIHEISRGAMGVVYRAEDLGLGRPVAIKVLRSDLAQNVDLVSRFKDEAAILASLHHRNLVQVHSFGRQGDDVYFVMELVEGRPLSDVLRELESRNEHLELALVSQIVEEIGDALDAMHAVGLIHRDVKPANILLDHHHGRAVLVDVGVARRRDARGDAAGTPGFAAPESFTDTEQTSATDVYGLAATTYMMLTGQAPFGSRNIHQVLHRQLYVGTRPPTELRDDLSQAIDVVVLKALEAESSKRYSSASAFAVAVSSAIRRAPSRNSDSSAPRRRSPITVRPTPASMSAVTHVVVPAADTSGAGGAVRGAIFRVAAKVLMHQFGEAWVRRMAESDASMAEILRPTLPASHWRPLSSFLMLMRKVAEQAAHGETPLWIDTAQLARMIGRSTISATFARFFGAEPTSLSPQDLLHAATSYWSKYHSWSRVRIEGSGENQELGVLVSGGNDETMSALVGGMLQRIVELAGGIDVVVTQASASDVGDGEQRFAVSWRTS